MNYRIHEKEAFKVLGRGQRIACANGQNHILIPQFWGEAQQNGLIAKLEGFAGEMGLIGVCREFDHNEQELTYAIAAEKPIGEGSVGAPDDDLFGSSIDLTEMEIPGATWAIFEVVGPVSTTIQEIWKKIYSDWFPKSEYQQADAPSLEVYPLGDTDSFNYRYEVWIPITKK